MEKDITFAYNKARWGVIANLAIAFCTLLWAFNAKTPTDFSPENLMVRSISPWVVICSCLTAALCNFLWIKDKDYVWLLNSANFLFWLFCPALISGDSWEMVMINDAGWLYCLFVWVMMSTTNFLLFKRPEFSIAKNKAILGTIANLLMVVFCAYLSYTCYQDMKYQEACGWEHKEDWNLAYAEVRVLLFLILPCVVSCMCNYFIARGKNLVWILNASNTLFWGVFIYDIYMSNSTYSSMPVIMIFILVWGSMCVLNYSLLGSIFKKNDNKHDETINESISASNSTRNLVRTEQIS